MSSEQKFTRKP